MRTPKDFFFKGVHLVLIEMVDCTEGSYFRNINVQINPIGYDIGHDILYIRGGHRFLFSTEVMLWVVKSALIFYSGDIAHSRGAKLNTKRAPIPVVTTLDRT